MPRNTYTIELNGDEPVPSGEEVTFTVGRAEPGNDGDPVVWVSCRVDDDPDRELDLPVIWGNLSALVGVAGPFRTGGSSGTAYVTLTPWKVKKQDPSVTFEVN
jgi:hypothetical protein